MRRRDFLTFSLAATIAPIAAQAQLGVPKVGVLVVGNPEPFWTVFRQKLSELGYLEGQNILLELRSAEKADQMPALAEELVRLPVKLIVAFQTPAVQAAKEATRDIPIVMSAGDPVGTGLVASLSRPGGNITGLSGATAELGGKMLELVREMLPKASRVGVLANAEDPFTKPFLEEIQKSGRIMGVAIQAIMVRGAEEFPAAFLKMQGERADAVIVQPSLPRQPAVDHALRLHLPAVSPTKWFPVAGGLMSYSARFAEMYAEAAVYVDKILKGAIPADLPVQQPTKFELVINLKTAKALGLTVPPPLLARADEVIE